MAGSDKRQRDKILPVRCLAEEYRAIAAKADEAGLSAGAFLRAAALENPGPRAQRRPPADHKALREILGHLGRIGNNLNQIAHALNARQPVDHEELQKALRVYIETRNAIFEALGKKPGPEP
jgi:hypothetical protein